VLGRVVVGCVLVAACSSPAPPPDAASSTSEAITFEGDLFIRSQADASQLVNVVEITGSLVIDGVSAEARDLRAVRANVTVTRGTLMAPALTEVGGTLTTCGTDMLRALTSVGGDIVVDCAGRLAGTCYWPALSRVDGGFTINREGDSVAAPLVPRLAFVRAVPPGVPWGEHGPVNVRAFTMEALTTIDAELDFAYTTLQFLVLPALQSVASIRIVSNAGLCNDVALELATRTGAPSEISSNNGSCAP
jgi:hypothetical protein